MTKAKTPKTDNKEANLTEVEIKLEDEWNDAFTVRKTAVELATDLFANTPFKNMLGATIPIGDSALVKDTAFYSLTLSLYEFLKTGTFKEYDKYLANHLMNKLKEQQKIVTA